MFKTKNGQLLDVKELKWQQARALLMPLLPELVDIIDKLSPGPDYVFYKAKYPFGTKIIDKTEAYLPLANGRTISFNDFSLPQNISKNLSYDPATSNPVGIVLNKYSEVYLTVNQKIIPYAVVKPGDIFGSARILDKADANMMGHFYTSFFMWELTSGVRSLFMLPKINENLSHQRLKKTYGLNVEKPETYKDHWNIFKDIAQKSKSNWNAEFLFFSTKWFEKLKEPEWAQFYCYFLRENRQHYKFWHNILSWQITIEQSKSLRYSPYTLDTAKALFAVAAGALPGFRPMQDEQAAPVKLLQQAYREGYGLTDYWPIIMGPESLSAESQPIYYSLNYPTLIQHNLTDLKGRSIISLLDELKLVTEKYQDAIKNNPIAKATPLHQIAMDTRFSYYHNDPIFYEGIEMSNKIPEEDSGFRVANNIAGVFPQYSFFFKGCVKVFKIAEV